MSKRYPLLLAPILIFIDPRYFFTLFWVSLFWFGPGFASGIELAGFQVNLMDLILLPGLTCCLISYFMYNRPILHSNDKFSNYFIILFIIIFQGLIIGIYLNSLSSLATDLRPFLYLFAVWLWVLFLINLFPKIDLLRLLSWIFVLGAIGALVKVLLILSGIMPDSLPLDAGQFMVLQSDELGATRINIMGVDSLCTIGVPFLTTIFMLRNKDRNTIIYLIGLLCSIVVLIFSFTRATWIGASVGTIVILLISNRYRQNSKNNYSSKIYYIVSGVAIIFLFLNMKVGDFEYDVLTLMSRRISGDYDTGGAITGVTVYRVREFWAVLDAIKDNPWLANGFGTSYLFKPLALPYGPQLWCHCGYIWILLKVGIVGTILFILALIFSIKRTAMLLYKNKVAPEEWPYVAGLLGGLIAFCLMNMTDNRFASPEMGAVLGLWFGLMGTIGIKEKKLLPKGCGSIMGKQ